MTQFNRRLSELEQRSPARGHVCQIVKVRADGTEQVIGGFWTIKPVDRILLKYEKVRKPIDTESSSNPGNLVDRVGD